MIVMLAKPFFPANPSNRHSAFASLDCCSEPQHAVDAAVVDADLVDVVVVVDAVVEAVVEAAAAEEENRW